MTDSLPIAAIIHAGKHMVDETLIGFIRELTAHGWKVRGLVPGPMGQPDNCSTRTVQDLHTQDIYPISQDLGKGSTACCLDPSALIAAAVVLHRARADAPDLAIVNRFGILEADGKGFVQEMLDFMTDGTPMLTVVSETYLEAWRNFTGGLAQELPPSREALYEWVSQLPVASRLPLPAVSASPV